MTKSECLKTYFGYDAFRPGQEAVVNTLLEGRDVLNIMPTGGGKSICYQVPALLLPGITLVVSPLVSLMRDQVTALVQSGVPAAFLNSSLTYRQYQLALSRARDGWYRIIYIAPERLASPAFQELARSLTISMVAVDEAHCISQWGQDFRPAYLDIPAFLDSLPQRPVVGAFTATATPRVREDIQRLLKLRDPFVQVTGFDRENLYFEVRQPEMKRPALLQAVREHRGECGIVYCSTRKNVEEVCDFLREEGLAVTRYHAGLEAEERRRNQEDFLFGRAQVMVATNAFGMGIDKADVRFVIHYNMPRDLESYYQEAGRAGRDGDPADCLLLYSGQDVITARWMIEHSDDNPELDADERAELQRRDLERLKQMTFYATSKRCLRAFLLRYFGEEAPDDCGSCSVCEELPFEVDTGRGRLYGVPAKEARQERKRRQESIPFTGWEAAQYENLRTLRALLAAHFHLPVYMIFSDASLRDMVQKRPKTEDEFLEVSGVGQAKLERYGSYFLAVLRDGKEPNSLLQGG